MKRVGNQSGAAMLMTMSLALAGAGASAPNNDAPATANAANDDLTSRITISSTCLFELLTSSNAFGLVCRDHPASVRRTRPIATNGHPGFLGEQTYLIILQGAVDRCVTGDPVGALLRQHHL